MTHIEKTIKFFVTMVAAMVSSTPIYAGVGNRFYAPIEYTYLGETFTVYAQCEVTSETEKTCMLVGTASSGCLKTDGMSDHQIKVVSLWASSMTVPSQMNGYTVTCIGPYSFYGIKHGHFILPETIEEIGSSAFEYAYMKQFQFPKNLKKIGSSAFAYNEFQHLDSLPETLESIGSNAFYNNKRLKSFTLPAKVSSIEPIYFFNYCDSLETIKVADGNTTYDSRNDCNAIMETSTNKLLIGCKSTKIPTETAEIYDYAFYRVKDFNVLNIPSACKKIRRWAFQGTGLKEITIPQNTFVEGGAFASCPYLEKAVIKCDTMIRQVFQNSKNLRTVYVLNDKFIFYKNGDGDTFYNIHPEAKLYVPVPENYQRDYVYNWFKEILPLKYVSDVVITDYEWPSDFTPVMHTAGTSTEGIEVEKVQYEMSRKTIYPDEGDCAEAGDNLGIGILVRVKEGYWFKSPLSASLDGKKQDFILAGSDEEEKRFVWVYTVPTPEGGLYIRTVDEDLTEPEVGAEPAWTVLTKEGVKNRDIRSDAKDKFDTQKHYSVSEVKWYEVKIPEEDGMMPETREMSEGDTFRSGFVYAALILLNPKEGYQFSQSTKATKGQFMLNVKEYTMGMFDIDSPAIGMDFEPKLKGDVNEDNRVDITDVVAIINHIAGVKTNDNADVTGDKRVDITDVVEVINIIAGIK